MMVGPGADPRSIATAAALAHADSTLAPRQDPARPGHLFFPLINISRAEFSMRKDDRNTLSRMGFLDEDFLFADEFRFDRLINNHFKIEITLVDHRALPETSDYLHPYVTSSVESNTFFSAEQDLSVKGLNRLALTRRAERHQRGSDRFYLSAFRNPRVRAFIRDAMRQSLGHYHVPVREVDSMVDILSSGYSQLEEARQALYQKGFDWESPRNRYYGIYQRYFNSLFKRIEPHVTSMAPQEGQVLLTIGSGHLDLPHRLLNQLREAGWEEKNIPRMIGIDLGDGATIEDPKIEHYRLDLENQGKIAVEGREVVDRVLIDSTLHRLPAAIQLTLMSEVNRLLKPGGEVIVIENATFDDLKPLYNGEDMVTRALALNDEERQQAFGLLEWHANTVMGLNPQHPMAGDFRTGKQWVEFFGGTGFQVADRQLLGISAEDITGLPRALFVLKKYDYGPIASAMASANAKSLMVKYVSSLFGALHFRIMRRLLAAA